MCSADPGCRTAEIPDRGRNENINKKQTPDDLCLWQHCSTALDAEVCNYMPLNNLKSLSSGYKFIYPNVQYNIIFYIISYIKGAE